MNVSAIKLISLIALCGLCSCASNLPIKQSDLWIEGYTCCNLHYDQKEKWISDGFVTSTPFIPAGTPVKVAKLGIRSFRADAEISGTHYRFGQDYGRTTEPFENWIKRLVIAQDPKDTIAGWSPEIRKAVKDGNVLIGMTKEQAMTSLGPPLRTTTPNLNAKIWRYWLTADNDFDIHWENGKVTEVRLRSDPSDTLTASETGSR